MVSQLSDNERWMMSFYRYSEITGALFFGRIAALVPAGQLQEDLTKHFSDESMHSWYWTQAISELGYRPVSLRNAYQDAYLEAAGLPVNLMEILAITNIFEKRVIGQYSRHLKVPGLNPVIKRTIERIVEDEKWHIQWINKALKNLAEKYGEDAINKKLQKYKKADDEIYGKLLQENQDRLQFLFDRTENTGEMQS